MKQLKDLTRRELSRAYSLSALTKVNQELERHLLKEAESLRRELEKVGSSVPASEQSATSLLANLSLYKKRAEQFAEEKYQQAAVAAALVTRGWQLNVKKPLSPIPEDPQDGVHHYLG